MPAPPVSPTDPWDQATADAAFDAGMGTQAYIDMVTAPGYVSPTDAVFDPTTGESYFGTVAPQSTDSTAPGYVAPPTVDPFAGGTNPFDPFGGPNAVPVNTVPTVPDPVPTTSGTTAPVPNPVTSTSTYVVTPPPPAPTTESPPGEGPGSWVWLHVGDTKHYADPSESAYVQPTGDPLTSSSTGSRTTWSGGWTKYWHVDTTPTDPAVGVVTETPTGGGGVITPPPAPTPPKPPGVQNRVKNALPSLKTKSPQGRGNVVQQPGVKASFDIGGIDRNPLSIRKQV